jgi:hypothetical protein
MSDLRLADEVTNAAKYFSAHEGTDVEVLCEDGSRTLYVKGEDVTPTWFATPTPPVQPGESASYPDTTPKEVRRGHWDNETEKFTSVEDPLSVPEFLELYKLAIQQRGVK